MSQSVESRIVIPPKDMMRNGYHWLMRHGVMDSVLWQYGYWHSHMSTVPISPSIMALYDYYYHSPVLSYEESEGLIKALKTLVYETTHLSYEKEDGSHVCKISKEALTAARDVLHNKYTNNKDV